MTTAAPDTALTPGGRARHRRAFWLIAVAFAATMSFTTVPTPMYGLYQARDGFPTLMITVIFAAYGFGVMAGLYFGGHVSDYLGRRRVLLGAVLTELVSCLIFVFFKDVGSLLTARFICGAGIGALTSTATAHLAELRGIGAPGEDGGRASLVASAVNTGGLALGPLVGGILTQWLPDPLTLPFVAFLVALALVAAIAFVAPETVDSPTPRPAYRPQRVSVSPEVRSEFIATGLAAAGSFAVLGFFTSLTGSVLGEVMRQDSRFVTGAVVFGAMGASSVSQVALYGLRPRPKLQTGIVLIVAGLVLVAVGAVAASLAVFTVGGVIAGAGIGLIFASSIAAANRMADPAARGETVAGMFLAAYAGITLPVIACGVLLSWVPTVTLVVSFATLIIVVAVASTWQMLRHTH
ncbi:MFS transporter [Flexivirga oryzae]|uniref:MFS family permease n=1 Tax=Flexivirga oryzae TaxID=1794944 RepID=A0A839NE84_9MICO|nr:MFS transporter [Flexivirga oryzae]MBB2893475.1 MFS family permease [Flexivirga oryzae]